MARSTPIVLAAGAIGMTDLVLNAWDPVKALKLGIGVVLAAYVSAGLDTLLEGWGTGLAVLLLLYALVNNLPRIVKTMFPT